MFGKAVQGAACFYNIIANQIWDAADITTDTVSNN
jgi:hypothetical protein